MASAAAAVLVLLPGTLMLQPPPLSLEAGADVGPAVDDAPAVGTGVPEVAPAVETAPAAETAPPEEMAPPAAVPPAPAPPELAPPELAPPELAPPEPAGALVKEQYGALHTAPSPMHLQSALVVHQPSDPGAEVPAGLQ